MRCMMCGADPATEATSVFRLNSKGQKGVWACRSHYAEAKARYFPDDDPSVSARPSTMPASDAPLGPWTGGVTPVEEKG